MNWENEQEKFEAIEAWLRSEMNEAEQTAFEARMAAESTFAEEVEIHRKLHQYAVDPALATFEQGVRELVIAKRETSSEHKEKPKTEQEEAESNKESGTGNVRPFPFRWVFAAAAVILLLLVVGWLAPRFLNSTPNPNTLYAEHYQSYPMVITLSEANLVRGPEDSLQLTQAEFAYRTKDYNTAFSGFQTLLSEEEYGPDIYFYYGISCLETEHYTEGKAAFETVLEDPESIFSEAANWYLGLLLLKSDQTDAAIAQFTKVKEQGGSYAERAGMILEKMEE